MDTKKLRQKILDLAIRGKLVPQDPNDEPASVLIEKIRAEKGRLIKEKKIKRDKNESYIYRSDKSYYEKFADGTVKCIDEEIPFEIPESWEWARLGSIARTILYGVSESAQTEGNYKLLRITDIQNNTVNWENVPFTTLPEDKAIEYLLRKDDILFARTGATVGKSYLVNEISNDTIYASYLIRVRLFELFESQYIKFYFESGFYWSQITDKSVGVGQPNVNGTSLKSLLISVPPYDEQSHIGEQASMLTSIIDNIDNNKNLLADSIKNVKSKILDLAIRGKLVPQDPNDEPASVLLERIKSEQPENKKKAKNISDNSHYALDLPKTWISVNLGLLFDVVSAKRVLKSEWMREGVSFYRVREIVRLSEDGYVENDLFISSSHFDFLKSNYGVPNKGDIMLSAVGSIGKTYIVKESDCFYYKDASVLCLKNIFKLNSLFYSLFFRSSFFQSQIYEKSKGTTVDTITIENARNFKIPLPPLHEQKLIVEKINEIFIILDGIADSIKA